MVQLAARLPTMRQGKQKILFACRGYIDRLSRELTANYRLVLGDTTMAGACAAFAVTISHNGGIVAENDRALLALTVISMLCAQVVLPVTGLYRKDSRSTSVGDAFVIVIAAALAVGLAWGIAMTFSLIASVPLSAFVIQFLATVPVWSGLRLAARHRELVRRNNRLKADQEGPIPVLLVGTGPNADLFIRSLRNRNAHFQVVGIVDDVQGTRGLFFHDIEIIGSVLDVGGALQALGRSDRLPERVFLAEPVSHFESDGVRAVLSWAEGHGIPVSQLPGLGGNGRRNDSARDAPREIIPEDVLDRPQQAVERSMLRRLIEGRRVLVTGAGGSIGSEMVRQIASLQPQQLVLVDNCEFNAYTIDMDLGRHFPNVPRHVHIASIRHADRIREIFMRHRPELVFNAAALKHVPLVEANPCEGVLTNIIGTRNVADAARDAGAIAMVQVSTDKAVNATSVMGATKRVAELYVQAQDRITHDRGDQTRFFAVRFGNVLGSSGSLIPLFQRQIQQGGPLTVTDERMTRYFMTIREAVQLTLVAASQGLARRSALGQVFVFDMGEPIRIVDLARRMIRLSGLEPGKDIEIKIIGMRPGEKLYEELFDDHEERRDSGIPGVSSAVPAGIPMARLRAAIHRLEVSARDGNEEAVRAGLRSLVPGYGAELPPLPAAPKNAASDQPHAAFRPEPVSPVAAE